MLRLGLIGTQSGHAASFANIAAGHRDRFSFTSAWDEDSENAAAFCERFGIPHQAGLSEQMKGEVDAVMITVRDGACHAELALPFLEAGIPVWVDKPFSISPEDAGIMLHAAKRGKAILAGGSNLKYCPSVQRAKALAGRLRKEDQLLSASFSVQALINSPYHGLHFYGPHSIDILLTVFGRDISGLSCRMVKGGAVAVFDMTDISVTANLIDCWDAKLTAYTPQRAINLNIGLYRLHENGMKAFIDMIEGNCPVQSAQSLLDPVVLMNAMIRSMESGGMLISNPLSSL